MRFHGDRLRLLLALALALAGAYGHFTLPLDVRNEAMKSLDGPDAAAQAERDREFGADDALVAMLEPDQAGPLAPELAAAWVAGLRAQPDVERVDPMPLADAGARLVALRLRRGGAELGTILERLRAAAPAGTRLSLTGQPAGELAIARALADEQARIVPAILLALCALLLLVYRRASLAAAALLPGLGGILLLGGTERLLGLRIDPVSTLLAPVLLTVGVAGSVHVVERYLRELTDGATPSAAAGGAVRHLARPLFLTSATTVAGFLSLTLGSLPAVVRFGWLASLGVALAMVWIVLVVPPWLRLTAARGRHAAFAMEREARRPRGARSRRYVERLARAAPLVVAATALASIYLGCHGARARTDTEPLRVLGPHHPFRVETERVQARLGGDEVFELYLPPPHPPLASLAAARFLAALVSDPLVALPAGAPRTSETGSMLVAALLRPSGTAERAALFTRAEARAVELGFPNAHATGPAVQVARDSEAVVRDQRRGLVAMLAALWILMAIGLRSPALALLGLVPNVVPCIALYGGLELAGRPLSVATAMIATVLLGLIVDNTIHLLHGYERERAAGSDGRSALARSIEHGGRAIVTTTIVLALGFGAGLVGTLATTVEFSLLAAGTIVLALACDLVLLPAALLLRARRAAPDPSVPAAAACVEITT